MATENAKKKAKKGGKSGSKNGFLKIVIIILALAALSVLISYFVSKPKSSLSTAVEPKKEIVNDQPKEPVVTDLPQKVKCPIDGSWVGLTSGVMLTLKDWNYSIDYSNVEGKKPLKGSFKVDRNKIIFSGGEKDSPCQGYDGIYTYQLNQGDLQLKAIDDECTKRHTALDEDNWMKF